MPINSLKTPKKMTESTKINFRYRKVRDIDDVTDLVVILFPGNRNQQHAAARILLVLKNANDLLKSFRDIEEKFGISRRTIERTRAKLARLGLIEHVSWMNRRYDGRQGWKLSGRMSTSLRCFADKIDSWRNDNSPDRKEKDNVLIAVLQ